LDGVSHRLLDQRHEDFGGNPEPSIALKPASENIYGMIDIFPVTPAFCSFEDLLIFCEQFHVMILLSAYPPIWLKKYAQDGQAT
jgi:hypothetical protein